MTVLKVVKRLVVVDGKQMRIVRVWNLHKGEWERRKDNPKEIHEVIE